MSCFPSCPSIQYTFAFDICTIGGQWVFVDHMAHMDMKCNFDLIFFFHLTKVLLPVHSSFVCVSEMEIKKKRKDLVGFLCLSQEMCGSSHCKIICIIYLLDSLFSVALPGFIVIVIFITKFLYT